VVAALVVGLLAAVVLPYRDAGVGTFLVLAAAAGTVAVAARRTAYQLSCALVSLLLLSTVVVRDADWIVVLCVLAGGTVAAAALAEGRSLTGLVASCLAVPLAGLRGLPWLGRSLDALRVRGGWLPAVRTLLLSVGLVTVFGLLFASADALFATWTGALLPDVSLDDTLLRGFVAAAVGGLTLAGVYVAANPPPVGRLDRAPGRPVARPFEWLVPVGLVTALFAVFVAGQLTVLFGGHAYLRRTTGLTYAAYVHEGFGQLTVTTLLTLVLVTVAARHAPRGTGRERLLLRTVLGVLCLLTLVVVASALYRMHVYEQAYGLTRLRLLVSVFEAWLGLVLLLVAAAGVRLRGAWVPRAVLLTGAVALLALAAANPDAVVARHNVERPPSAAGVDASYLSGLSADAVPTLVALGVDPALLPTGDGGDDDWLEWNLGRWRARPASG
jgi:hypothetical protein